MRNEKSFEAIAEDILINRRFQQLSREEHHGITRMEHTLRVANSVYDITKRLNMNYVSATRAALLHDFFINKDYGDIVGLKKGVEHPSIALKNAKECFYLNELEANAIEAHMFPLSKVLPKYKESWVLSIVDKGVALYECFNYKFSYMKISNKLVKNVNFAVVFLFYVITMGRK